MGYSPQHPPSREFWVGFRGIDGSRCESGVEVHARRDHPRIEAKDSALIARVGPVTENAPPAGNIKFPTPSIDRGAQSCTTESTQPQEISGWLRREAEGGSCWLALNI